MEPEVITAIENTSQEYREYAGVLGDTLEYLRKISEAAPEDDKVPAVAAGRLSLQIRELLSIAEALESIALNYRHAMTMMAEEEISFEGAERGTEFGVSTFDNLSKHEKLMPIHSS